MSFKFVNPFKLPSAEVIAAKELAESRRNLLVYQQQAEYNSYMCAFEKGRIARLTAMLEVAESGAK